MKKYITDFDELTGLSKRIVKAHPDGFLQAIIDGDRGSGKTAFCLHTMREVYQYIYGVDRVDAWNMIFGIGSYSHDKPKMMFTIRDVIDALRTLDKIDMDDVGSIIQQQRDLMIPCVTWDDAGMHGGRLKVLIDMQLVDKLSGVMDTARDVTTGFLINVPEKEALLSAIRRYHDILWGHVGYRPSEGAVKYNRQVVVRKYATRPDGVRRYRTIFATNFSCYVEKWVYSEYKRRKISAVQDNLRFLEELEKKKENRRRKDRFKEIKFMENIPEESDVVA